MKKVYNRPEIAELDFSETSSITCGVKGRHVIKDVSGRGHTLKYGNCFSIMTLFGSDSSFDDASEEINEFDENED